MTIERHSTRLLFKFKRLRILTGLYFSSPFRHRWELTAWVERWAFGFGVPCIAFAFRVGSE